jgi:ribA/ribD-fused uncharacterized protein
MSRFFKSESLFPVLQMDIRKIEFFGQHRLSNAYRCTIVIDGVWPTVEHYYQAQRFPDAPDYQAKIRHARHAADARRLGNARAARTRPDWDRVKDDIMYAALIAKFTQHAELKHYLLSTDGAILVERSLHDNYWGCGPEKEGYNMLGYLLMQLRNALL